ncbi:MAG TPA: FAD-dependent oxidoreductase [Gemmatimonadaceae bacterium]|jgi:pyruvate/2-oxoglutarate dehydrogenase complex dihydrolipoamide dehydrogenase (E3) component|nr:FAD-dependent oxidoreductase [Gemmatimonadaceae bacterium]
MDTFDAIVIGAGEAGVEVANRAVKAGKRVALIYRAPFGSTCLNAGCVPSKFLIHRARVAHVVRSAARFHVDAALSHIRLGDIVREMDAMIDGDRTTAFEAATTADHLTLIEGPARFLSREVVLVGRRCLYSRKIFIATGQRPRIPDVLAHSSPRVLTSDSIMRLTEPPEHLLIVGGGYIACELGQAYHRFGSRVTIVQRGDHLVPREEPDVSTILEGAFQTQGIDILLGQQAVRLHADDKSVRLSIRAKDGTSRSLQASHLLIAAGREPNSDLLDLDAAGVAVNGQGYVKVNGRLETNVPGVWAIGDINGEQPFTRVCQEEGRVAFLNAFENGRLTIRREALGHAVFTDPEIGSVGYTESGARELGIDTAVGLVTFDRIEKARLMGETSGLIKYVVERSSHRVVGCHVVGPNAADLVYDAVLVMRHNGTLDEIGTAVGVFPTLQEGMEGTAKGLLTKLTPHELRGPLVREKSKTAAMEEYQTWPK